MTAENWNRKTWSLAGPVIISNVSVPLLGAVDIAVVGHLPGPHYLGSVASAARVFWMPKNQPNRAKFKSAIGAPQMRMEK